MNCFCIAASSSNKLLPNEREFSVWVGDLSPEVDDYNLYRIFSNKYSSIKTAKVILDSSGFSKGYGFVRFGLEEEQKSALYEMNGYIGLGSKPLKICNAVPKPKSSSTTAASNETNPVVLTTSNSMTEFSQYYDPSTYWQYGQQAWYDSTNVATDFAAYYQQQASHHQNEQLTQLYNQQANEDMTLVGNVILFNNQL